MRKPLGVAVAQPSCVPYNVSANAVTHAAAVRSAGARVVIFPELSLTGYEMDAPPIGVDDPRLTPIIQACAETGSVALVGAPLRGVAGQVHIAMLAIDSNSATVAYRKLFLSARESERFTPGNTPAVLNVDGWRLGLAICRDTSIPQHVADTTALGIDAYVAGTLMFTDETTLQNERASRIAATHHIWVALASFAGSTGSGYTDTAGRSGIWACTGDVVAQAGPEPGAIAQATWAQPHHAASLRSLPQRN